MEFAKVTTLMKATALELAILTGHLVLYPTGIVAERLAPAPPDASPEGLARGRRPVLLLHGFVDNRSVFVMLRRSLARHGRDGIETLNYSPLTCDLRAAAELLGRRVEEIRARTGHAEVDIVGHSLGGLIARYYVQCLGVTHGCGPWSCSAPRTRVRPWPGSPPPIRWCGRCGPVPRCCGSLPGPRAAAGPGS